MCHSLIKQKHSGQKLYFVVKEGNTRVTSLEQLSLAEFSGDIRKAKGLRKRL